MTIDHMLFAQFNGKTRCLHGWVTRFAIKYVSVLDRASSFINSWKGCDQAKRFCVFNKDAAYKMAFMAQQFEVSLNVVLIHSVPAGIQTDICAQTKKAKQKALWSSVIPQRPNYPKYSKSLKRESMTSNRIGRTWKMPIAKSSANRIPNFPITIKFESIREKTAMRAINKCCIALAMSLPITTIKSHLHNSEAPLLWICLIVRPILLNSKMSASISKDSPKKESISRKPTPISGDKLLERYSVLPDIMKAVTHLNRQTNRVKEGAKLLRALRQKSGLAERSKRKDKMLMVGSQRRQYVRTFFGKDVKVQQPEKRSKYC